MNGPFIPHPYTRLNLAGAPDANIPSPTPGISASFIDCLSCLSLFAPLAYLAYDQPGQRDPSIDCPSGIPASAHSCHFPPIFIPKPWKLPGWLSATDLWVLEASSCTQEKDGIMRITQ